MNEFNNVYQAAFFGGLVGSFMSFIFYQLADLFSILIQRKLKKDKNNNEC